jgi:replicative DNA helicase
MLQKIRNKEKLIQFDRLYNLNQRVKIKKRTLNVIAARPSEGKSALALNLFCDLSKSYKCIYFNMEMTEEEIYERMLGIESSIPIEQIIKPQTDYQEETIKEVANKIYSYKYEVVNGSMNIKGLVSKIIREQREEHLIVFIDYVGYISNKAGQSDKDRIGEVTRMLNDVTKDYNCTIMLVAQINRNGSDTPTMEDLKDSGELEQSADTIILIHDENKQDVSSTKFIKLLIPKCRGSKRNIAIEVKYLKESQRMEVL